MERYGDFSKNEGTRSAFVQRRMDRLGKTKDANIWWLMEIIYLTDNTLIFAMKTYTIDKIIELILQYLDCFFLAMVWTNDQKLFIKDLSKCNKLHTIYCKTKKKP